MLALLRAGVYDWKWPNSNFSKDICRMSVINIYLISDLLSGI